MCYVLFKSFSMKINNWLTTTFFTGSLVIAGTQSASAVIFGQDDFDSNRVFNSFTVNPDNSSNNGLFTDPNDVFGITNRDFAPDALVDDSTSSSDTLGILTSTQTDNVFGIVDLTNPDNSSGTGTATWVFDISGGTNLSISIDFAAMGDFEISNDSFIFSASIDGSTPTNIFTSSIDEAASLDYTLESGTFVNLDDPLSINGTTLNNEFQTIDALLSGTGSTLTLTLSANQEANTEIFAFDNIVVTGDAASVPFEFSPTLGLLAMGSLCFGARLRKYRKN